jgi:anti-sigma-K factor RskA
MTDRPSPKNDDDLLAVEYVMGLLDGPDWQAAHQRAAVDGAFAARVRAWETHLAPLNDDYGTEPLPIDGWARLNARIAPTAKPARRRWWAGLATGTATVAALVLALAFIPVNRPAPLPGLQAELTAPDAALVVRAQFDASAGQIALALDGPPAGAGQDYELWLIDGNSAPRPLGLLRGQRVSLAADLRAGQTLAISLEPAGGSPTGAPTGPVLAVAVLTGS